MPLAAATQVEAGPPTVEWGLVIHGGAGNGVTRENISPERDAEYRAKLQEALRAGHRVLADGGSAVDAVVAAITIMEDSPMFNAGKGAVFTSSGTNELDASIMSGADLNAGAVAGVKRVKNPIVLARAVMEHSRHVMFAREGAETFAEEQGLELVPESYFYTERRMRALERAKEREAERSSALPRETEKFGTVGAVALDRAGNLAAGTSTGGITNKRWGRVGDSPVIGAGTYASNESCGVSATGQGEFFIRNVVAHDICARVQHAGASVKEAADAVVMDRLVRQEAGGGVVVLGANGEIAMAFNTAGMLRGWIGPDGAPTAKLYGDE
ncbi:MAG: isoaspartyl peptidase/L-asparaginase [Gemmatimonadota bacterium]